MRYFKLSPGIILLFFVIFSGCRKADEIEDNIPSIEAYVREHYDKIAIFTFNQYEDLLKVLSDDKFIVLPLNKMIDSVNISKVIVGMRHDIDCHPFKAVQMAELENKYGFRATYFVLPTARYYGLFYGNRMQRFYSMTAIYKKIASLGAEIGIHNDLITIMVQYKLDPVDFNSDDFAFFNSMQIPIYGSSAHGADLEKRLHVVNYEIFSDFAEHPFVTYNGKQYKLGLYSLKEFGYLYEAYHIEDNLYFSDVDGQFKGGYDGFIESLKNSRPGDRIQILTHPELWGK